MQKQKICHQYAAYIEKIRVRKVKKMLILKKLLQIFCNNKIKA